MDTFKRRDGSSVITKGPSLCNTTYKRIDNEEDNNELSIWRDAFARDGDGRKLPDFL